MPGAEWGSEFTRLTAALAAEVEGFCVMERDAAFTVEPRPIPEGLIPIGIPLEHIAFMGDFDQAPQQRSDDEGKKPAATYDA